MITAIEDYFTQGCGRCVRFATPDCSARRWTKGLADLRRICLDTGLTETVKWGHPCYMHAGRNIAVIGAFRDDFRLSFFNAALLKDGAGVLERPGPNTRHAAMIRMTAPAMVADLEGVLRAYLREAMDYAAAGKTAPKEAAEIVLPDELVEALDADPELTEAFYGLTPNRQRSYVIALSSAKAATTRVARIAKFRSRILAGKGATER
jgi:uncharacterized protein YdeI (YjbR/CyaY-like superfamily)